MRRNRVFGNLYLVFGFQEIKEKLNSFAISPEFIWRHFVLFFKEM